MRAITASCPVIVKFNKQHINGNKEELPSSISCSYCWNHHCCCCLFYCIVSDTTAAATVSTPAGTVVSSNNIMIEAEQSSVICSWTNSLHDIGPAVKRARVPPNLCDVSLSPIMHAIQYTKQPSLCNHGWHSWQHRHCCMRDRILSCRTTPLDEATVAINISNPTKPPNQETAACGLNSPLDNG